MTSIFRNIFTRKYFIDKPQTEENQLKDVCTYLLFLMVTTIITMSSREIGMFYFNNTIEKLFLNRYTSNKHGLELTYEELVTISEWWSFVETTFLESIEQFEQNDSLNQTNERNVLLGFPRLRQIRVQSEKCQVDKMFHNQLSTCFGHYVKSKEDVSVFLGSRHLSQDEAKTYSIWGSIARYHGAGFVKMLSFDSDENEEIINELRDENWIDGGTRLVIVEFALFNADANLFCNAKLLAEVPATGGVVTSSQIQPLKYTPIWNERGYFVPFCSVIFLILIFSYTLEVIYQAEKLVLTSHFPHFFNILDLLILLIAYLSIAYVVWHIFYLKSILVEYELNPEQHLSLDIVCFWNRLFVDMMGICAFITWIKVFKYIQFNNTMKQFSTTFRRCAKDLFGFSILFSIVFIAFAYLSVMLFGTVDSDFHSFQAAFLTLMRTVLGDFDYAKLEAANRILGPIFFLVFILFVFFILLNMFLAIINDTYSDVKSEITESEGNPFEKFLKSLYQGIKNLIPLTKKKVDINEETITKEYPTTSDSTQPKRSSNQTSPSASTDSKLQKDKEITIINTYFEPVPIDIDEEEEESLQERVTLVEEKLEKLVEALNITLQKVQKN